MENIISKILKITESTGERCIVTDSEGKSAFVVMTLDQYQGLKSTSKSSLDRNDIAGLTEEQLLNKINGEIALWKSSQVSQGKDFKPSLAISQDLAKNIDKASQVDEKYYFEPVDDGK